MLHRLSSDSLSLWLQSLKVSSWSTCARTETSPGDVLRGFRTCQACSWYEYLAVMQMPGQWGSGVQSSL